MRGQDSTKMDLGATGCEDVDWIQVAQDSVQWLALMKTVMNLLVPQKMGNILPS
jgi:hypothetical protein